MIFHMRERKALKIVFWLGIFGTAFSGTLSYQELFQGATTCPVVGAPGTIFGYPACVYGFVMFAVLTIIAGVGLWGNHRTPPHA